MEETTQKYLKEFDEKFVFQTGDWTELGGRPDHQEWIADPEEVKAFLKSSIERAVRDELELFETEIKKLGLSEEWLVLDLIKRMKGQNAKT